MWLSVPKQKIIFLSFYETLPNEPQKFNLIYSVISSWTHCTELDLDILVTYKKYTKCKKKNI